MGMTVIIRETQRDATQCDGSSDFRGRFARSMIGPERLFRNNTTRKRGRREGTREDRRYRNRISSHASTSSQDGRLGSTVDCRLSTVDVEIPAEKGVGGLTQPCGDVDLLGLSRGGERAGRF